MLVSSYQQCYRHNQIFCSGSGTAKTKFLAQFLDFSVAVDHNRLANNTQKKIALNIRKMKFCATCAQKYMEEKTRFSLSTYSTQFFVSVKVQKLRKNPTKRPTRLKGRVKAMNFGFLWMVWITNWAPQLHTPTKILPKFQLSVSRSDTRPLSTQYVP
jgi:hypothetical protein